MLQENNSNDSLVTDSNSTGVIFYRTLNPTAFDIIKSVHPNFGVKAFFSMAHDGEVVEIWSDTSKEGKQISDTIASVPTRTLFKAVDRALTNAASKLVLESKEEKGERATKVAARILQLVTDKEWFFSHLPEEHIKIIGEILQNWKDGKDVSTSGT